MVPEIAAGARDGGPFQLWSDRKTKGTESETSVTAVLAAARYNVGRVPCDWKVRWRLFRFLKANPRNRFPAVRWVVRESGFVPGPCWCTWHGFGFRLTCSPIAANNMYSSGTP